jgi:hypothetical protein
VTTSGYFESVGIEYTAKSGYSAVGHNSRFSPGSGVVIEGPPMPIVTTYQSEFMNQGPSTHLKAIQTEEFS